MARTADTKTRGEALYLDVRARLLRGEMAPGQPIRTDELCANYGVSVSLVREVLTRLAAQRLLISEANKGFRVTPISAEHIQDLCVVRTELESLTVRLAIEKGDIEWEASVIAAHHRLANTPRPSIAEDPEGNERWAIAHSEFHSVCADGCGSPRLCAVRQSFFDEAEIFRQYSRLYGGNRDVEAEHAAITDAIVTRNAALADELVRAHVELTAKATLVAWTERVTTTDPGDRVA
jgi:GntR family transcriptional regulator, carbon starvation induced regulator